MLAALKKEQKLKNITVKINKSVGISKSNRYRQKMNDPRDPKAGIGQRRVRTFLKLVKTLWNRTFEFPHNGLRIVKRLVRLQLQKTIFGNLLKRIYLLTGGEYVKPLLFSYIFIIPNSPIKKRRSLNHLVCEV